MEKPLEVPRYGIEALKDSQLEELVKFGGTQGYVVLSLLFKESIRKLDQEAGDQKHSIMGMDGLWHEIPHTVIAEHAGLRKGMKAIMKDILIYPEKAKIELEKRKDAKKIKN